MCCLTSRNRNRSCWWQAVLCAAVLSDARIPCSLRAPTSYRHCRGWCWSHRCVPSGGSDAHAPSWGWCSWRNGNVPWQWQIRNPHSVSLQRRYEAVPPGTFLYIRWFCWKERPHRYHRKTARIHALQCKVCGRRADLFPHRRAFSQSPAWYKACTLLPCVPAHWGK